MPTPAHRSWFVPRCIATIFACCALALVSSFAADAAPKQKFDLPAAPAAKSLKLLSEQSGKPLIADADVVRGVTTNAVHGEFTAQEAATRMLAGTGLVATLDEPSGSFTVRREDLRPNDQRAIATSGRPQKSEKTDDSKTEDGTLKLPAYMVVGTKTLDADIRRTENDAQPYVVFDSKQIENSGATNLEDFFRKRLTMNTQQQSLSLTSSTSVASGLTTNVSQINLRGLGIDETLILIDGRRAPRVLQLTGTISTLSQADINGIPLSAIERIEILPSTAGGIYGGGATGGVINIIRKHNYRGLTLRLQYDTALHGNWDNQRAEVSGGFGLWRGKTQVDFNASSTSSAPLYVQDNDLWQRARARLIQTEAAAVALGGVGSRPLPLGYTTNILSQTGVVLTLKSTGQSLGSDRTYVPVGYAGVTSDGGAALVANAGKYNLDLANDVAGRFAPLTGDSTVKSGNLNIRQEISPGLQAFLDFAAADNIARGNTLVIPTLMNLPATATNNPFQQAIRVQIPFTGGDRPYRNDSYNSSITGGLIARLGANWTASGEYTWSTSRTKNYFTVSNPILLFDPVTFLPKTEFTTALQNGALNPIRDTNALPLDIAQYLSDTSTTNGPRETQQSIASARLSGALMDIPAGQISITALAEHRQDLIPQYAQLAAVTGVTSTILARSQSVDSGYIEIGVPLVAESHPKLLAQLADLQSSVRFDRYSTRTAVPTDYLSSSPPSSITYSTAHVQSLSYTTAFRWKPSKDLTLRASFATGFLPPSIAQIQPSFPSQGGPGGIDPKRGNTPLPTFVLLTGGNPGLRPETSRSWTAGAIFVPRFVPHLRLSIDYSRIQKADEIGTPQPTNLNQLGDFEALFPTRVVRAPLAAADQALGYTGGVVQSIDFSLINLANTRLQAWDLKADYEFDLGRGGKFHAYASATKQTEYLVQATAAADRVNTVGYINGPLEWRFNSGVDWQKGNWEAGWNMQFYDRYSVRSITTVASITSAANNLTVATQGEERIPSQVYHDMSLRYRFGSGKSGFFRDLDVTFWVQNMFNQFPPIYVASLGGYSAYGDPRLRRFALSVRKGF